MGGQLQAPMFEFTSLVRWQEPENGKRIDKDGDITAGLLFVCFLIPILVPVFIIVQIRFSGYCSSFLREQRQGYTSLFDLLILGLGEVPG